jgi:hypothetical protein
MAKEHVRRALRVITVECPALSEDPVQLREPRVRDFIEANKATSNEERTIILLGAMVLDPSGNPVGREAVLDFPLNALGELAGKIGPLIGEEEAEAPLALKSGSATGSVSH